MNGLLQRLAGQALGASGTRVRAAAAVHAQVPIAGPVRERRVGLDRSPTLEIAAPRTTTAPPPGSSSDSLVLAAPPPVGVVVERSAHDDSDHQAQHRVPAAASAGRATASERDTTTAPVPARLLGEVAAAVDPIRPDLKRETRNVRGGESTEVHVHIGRIEVTALTEPASPKRRERPARQSVPLSDYLAKRSSS